MIRHSGVILCAATLAACAGREAQPVIIAQASDPQMNCRQLATELTNLDQDIARLNHEGDKTKQNAFFGAAAAVLIVPALYLDSGKAEREELAAKHERETYLLSLADRKGCGFKVHAEEPKS